MLTINFDFYGKARVWLDHSLSIFYPVINSKNQIIQTNLIQKFTQKQVGVELFIPVSGINKYGLLGVEFIPDNSGKLAVEVYLSTENEAIFDQSIAGKLDQVRIGLPVEYSQSVIEGVNLALNDELIEILGSGILRFNKAAHGEIGSSNHFFRQITATVIKLLLLDSITDQIKVTEIIKTCNLV